ncbi:hypothetical protein [Gluconobacter japonicus]|uniref:hypothetical protein n=1 Tax=Gluconobacter japonicus TaxID=376620 RepID=UPI0035E93ABC
MKKGRSLSNRFAHLNSGCASDVEASQAQKPSGVAGRMLATHQKLYADRASGSLKKALTKLGRA